MQTDKKISVFTLVYEYLKPGLLTGAAVTSVLGVGPATAVAEEEFLGIEEVIVTARRREESLQDVPIAVTAMSGDYLEKHSITNLQDIALHVPSLGFSLGGGQTNAPVISLRGQRPSETVITLDAAIPMYFADVVLAPGFGTNLSLYDLSNVQVVKGPQGTLFGRNSTGGAILMTPRAPGEEFGGNVEFKVGDYHLFSTNFGVDLPVNDDIRIRIAGQSIDRDGYQDNNFLGKSDYAWDEDSEALRFTLQTNLTDSLTNTLIVDWAENDSISRLITPVSYYAGGRSIMTNAAVKAALEPLVDEQVADNWQEGNSDLTSSPEDVENWIVANTTTWEIDDSLTAKSILGYRHVEWVSRFDTDGTALTLFGSQPFSNVKNTVEAEQWSAEFQLLGTDRMNGKLDWIAGVYYYNSQGTQDSPVQVVASSAAPFTTPGILGTSPTGDSVNEAYAIFGEATYDLTEELAFTFGVRQSWDRRQATVRNNMTMAMLAGGPLAALADQRCTVHAPGVVPAYIDIDGPGPTPPFPITSNNKGMANCSRTVEDIWDKATWRAMLTYEPTDTLMMYGSISTGYRTGGFNLRGGDDESLEPFDDETVTNFEIGSKVDWQLGDEAYMRTNMAVYVQKYEDIQKTDAKVVGGTVATITGNADEATIQGVELEALLVPVESVELGLNYAYTFTEYDKWEEDQYNAAGTLVEADKDVDHRTFAWIPDYTATAFARYTLPLDESIGEVSIQMSYYYSAQQGTSNTLRHPSDLTFKTGVPIDSDDFERGIHENSYKVIDYRIDWTSVMGTSVDVAAWLKNANDEQYQTGGLEVLDGLGLSARSYGPPRTWGVSMNYHF